jgi:hypothetical protein
MAQFEPRKGGLRWFKSRSSSGVGGMPIVRKVVASNNTNAIGAGSPCKAGTDGCIVASAAGEVIDYVAVSVERYRGSDGFMRPGAFLPAATTYTGTTSQQNPFASVVVCIPVKDQIFELDVPTAAATQTAATDLIGNCVDVVVNSVSSISGQSGATAGTVASFVASTAQLILREIPQYGASGAINDVTKTYWKGLFEVYEQGDGTTM